MLSIPHKNGEQEASNVTEKERLCEGWLIFHKHFFHSCTNDREQRWHEEYLESYPNVFKFWTFYVVWKTLAIK